MIRLGLCCIFRDAPIRFRTTTATAVLRLGRAERLRKLSDLALANAEALATALRYCAAHGIGAFRINSQILPVKTHPRAGYAVDDLPAAAEIRRRFRACGRYARAQGLRLSFHPDQFVVLNAMREDVVRGSLAELEYQAEVAGWVGADVINIHGGGAYGDKPSALARLRDHLRRLSSRARRLLTLENDDRTFTPADLLPLCEAERIPLVYDVHHHRCLPDGLSEVEVTRRAAATWRGREPLFHLSSPLNGWGGPHPGSHHDRIDPDDFPEAWRRRSLTVDIEAKDKERAVEQVAGLLAERGIRVGIPRRHPRPARAQ